MTPCEEFRHLMLEGEPRELRGEGDSPLATHLRACPRCALAAGTVLAETERLDAFLTRHPSDAQVDAVLDRAGWGASPSAPRAAGRSSAAPGAGRGGRRWAFLAAAAAVGALLLLPGRAVPPGPALPEGGVPRPPTVEAMSGRSVAVMETGNPEITVLWFF